MLLRWLNKQRFDASRPASGRLPANCRRSLLDLRGSQRLIRAHMYFPYPAGLFLLHWARISSMARAASFLRAASALASRDSRSAIMFRISLHTSSFASRKIEVFLGFLQRRLPAQHHQISHRCLHGFVILIQRVSAHFHQSLLRLGSRRPYFEYFAFHP